MAHARPKGAFAEMIVHREGMPDVENPYWQDEDSPPHPDPSKGCIRRGICCRSNPGWFGPGEAEEAARLLGMEPDAFVRRWLVVDAHEVDGEVLHVFAPVKLARDGTPAIPTGTVADRLYRSFRGPCVFFEGGGCRIYAARPVECRLYVCTNEPEANPTHEGIARLWKEARDGA